MANFVTNILLKNLKINNVLFQKLLNYTFKWMNCTVCKLYFNKAAKKKKLNYLNCYLFIYFGGTGV
jgi:hypothetical protein